MVQQWGWTNDCHPALNERSPVMGIAGQARNDKLTKNFFPSAPLLIYYALFNYYLKNLNTH
jgi:hypothetical protein